MPRARRREHATAASHALSHLLCFRSGLKGSSSLPAGPSSTTSSTSTRTRFCDLLAWIVFVPEGFVIPVDITELQFADTLPATLFARLVIGARVMVGRRRSVVTWAGYSVNINTRGKGCKVRFTILVFVFPKIIVEHKVFDPLLLFLLCLLLVLHRNGEVGVRWQLDSSCLRSPVSPQNGTILARSIRTCWRFPFLVRSEKAIVPLMPSVVFSPASFDVDGSRIFVLRGRGRSNCCFRSNFRDSRLSAIIFAYSRSNSASSSGSTSSSCLVTTIASSSDSLSRVDWLCSRSCPIRTR